MILKNSFQILVLLGFLGSQCSPPREVAPPKSKAPHSSEEQLAKVKMTDLDGRPLSLQDFSGKPIFLNFWATWCGPCVSEMASIEKASQVFKDDIVFLAVSNESAALIKSYQKRNKFSFKFARLEVPYLDVYVVALPTTLLIDEKGTLVAEESGLRNWASPASIEKLKALAKK